VIESRTGNQEVILQDYFGQEVSLEGKVVKEPDIRENNTKLTIKARLSRESRALNKILVTVSRYPEYKYGDILQVKGELQEPVVFEDFNYKDYLKTKGILAVMYYPQTELKSRGPSSPLLKFKDRLRENIYSSIPPPQADILGALILGDKNRISDDFKEKLNVAGIRHLTAVSGMHVVIISSVLLSLFLFLGFWKRQAIYVSLLCIFLFIALTGFQTSSIRAGIMGSLFLVGPLFGRKSDSIRALVLAGLIMLVFNPFLVYDAGFQLSFLAAFGIIYLSSVFKKHLRSDVLAATFSAYIFTLPVLVYSFGRVSLVGVFTNFLVLPIIPVVMVLGFASALVKIVSFIPLILLTYIVKITETFSQPWMAQSFVNINWLWLVPCYLALFLLGRYFKKREFWV